MAGDTHGSAWGPDSSDATLPIGAELAAQSNFRVSAGVGETAKARLTGA